MPSSLEKATNFYRVENDVQRHVANACEDIGFDTNTEWETGEGPVDIFLPRHRILIECKATDKVGPELLGKIIKASMSENSSVEIVRNETQFEQLKRYVVAERKSNSEYWFSDSALDELVWTGILTDGRQWWIWEWPPEIGKDNPTKITPILFDARTNLDNVQRFLENKYHKTDGSRSLVPDKPAQLYEGFEAELTSIWQICKKRRNAQTQMNLWLDTIRASGMAPEDDASEQEMFVRHCVLVTIARAVTMDLLKSDLTFAENREFTTSDGFINWISTDTSGQDWCKQIQTITDQYDWRRRPRDVLRNLYEDIIPKNQRKIYGEYYTPDWLAEMLANEILDKEWLNNSVEKALIAIRSGNDNVLNGVGVLDPTCGSGTFLYHAARRLLKSDELQYSDLLPREKSDVITRLVHGIDIHPVAVEFSKTNLLRALPAPPTNAGAALRIWQGDALLIDWGQGGLQPDLLKASQEEKNIYTFHSPSRKRTFSIPITFTEQPSINKDIRQFVERARSQGRFPSVLMFGLNNTERKVLREGFEALKEICKEEGNGIWAHYILNTISPYLLSKRKVNRILSNPPWVRLNEIQVQERKQSFQQLANDLYIWPGGRNATSFDIAATFIMQCGQIYLVGQKARAAWLANHASTKATSWNEFRKQFNRRVSQNYYIEFDKLRELPFTGASSCAWIQGISSKNKTMLLVNKQIKIKRANVWSNIKELTKIVDAPKPPASAPSNYIDSNSRAVFKNGATIFPQSLVKINMSKPIINHNDTVEGVTEFGKHQPWKQHGGRNFSVPASWIVDVVFSFDLLPYSIRNPVTQCIIPLNNEKTELQDSPQDQNAYWREATAVYEDERGIGGNTPPTLLARLDHQKALSSQLPESNSRRNKRTRVVYNGSGSSLRSARVSLTQIVEHGCYRYDAKEEEEALYLVAILNARALQERFRNSRVTDRHFDTHPWFKIPIKKFNRKDPNHRKLTNLAKGAEKTADEMARGAGREVGQIKLTSKIHEAIADKGISEKIDKTLEKVLLN